MYVQFRDSLKKMGEEMKFDVRNIIVKTTKKIDIKVVIKNDRFPLIINLPWSNDLKDQFSKYYLENSALIAKCLDPLFIDAINKTEVSVRGKGWVNVCRARNRIAYKHCKKTFDGLLIVLSFLLFYCQIKENLFSFQIYPSYRKSYAIHANHCLFY